MKLIIIIIINIEKKNVQNLKWATAHLSRRLGAGARRRERWGAGLGAGSWARGRVAGAGRAWARRRALQAVRRPGAGRSGCAGVRSRRGARQAGRTSGRRTGRQVRGRQAHGACAAGALLGARSSRGTGVVRAAMHGLSVTWALDGCAGWASWASFGA